MHPTNAEMEWLTITQASRHLNFSVAFLRKLVRTNSVPFARVGSKALRFRRHDLDMWMEAKVNGTATSDFRREQ